MSLKFGTSGVRALVSDLTDRNVYLMTTAFLKYATSLNTGTANVYTGMDLRGSSSKIVNAVHVAISDAGKKSFFCGEVPTPCLAHYALANQSLAIMITGSHIPADRNGIKFYLQSGETLKQDDARILEIYNGLLNSDFKSSAFDDQGSFTKKSNSEVAHFENQCKTKYEKRYLDFFTPQSLKNLKVVFYEHSSVARSIIPGLLEKLGATIISVGRSTTFVAVDTEAVESVDKFADWIKEHKADALISTDGDADRPLVMDNTGAVVPGDTLGMLSCDYLNIEAVALPISCNSSINEMPNLREVSFTKIGSPYVVDALNELAKRYNRVAGFEANGGFILKSPVKSLDMLPTRDSMLPLLCALAKIKETGKSLAQLATTVNKRFTASVLVKNCPLNISEKLLATVSDDPQSIFKTVVMNDVSDLTINKLDGVRLSSADYVIHFRPSGNAPEFRCYTEASTPVLAQEIADRAKKYISEYVQKASATNS